MLGMVTELMLGVDTTELFEETKQEDKNIRIDNIRLSFFIVYLRDIELGL